MPTCNDADAFMHFFDEKVKPFVHQLQVNHCPHPLHRRRLQLACRCRYYHRVVKRKRQLIMQSPTKSCAPDPIATYLLKEMVDVLLP